MNAHFKYLGNNCGLIHSFPYDHGAGKYNTKANWDTDKEIIIKEVKDQSNFALLGITADYFQKQFHSILKELGFRKVICFKSSHNVDKENLTLWVKENRKAKNVKNLLIEDGPYNCSVSFNKDDSINRLAITTTNPNSDKYRKIRGVNAWYKIDKTYLVNS